MNYKRYADQIRKLLNGRPDIQHPLYEFCLSDAITIALDKLHIRFESLANATTLEQVRDLLCENNPSHTWVTGAVALELLDSVLSVAPTHFRANLDGGGSVTVRVANKDDFSDGTVRDGKRFIMDKFVNVRTGHLVAVGPADVAMLDGMRLSTPAFECASETAGLTPSAMIATLTGSSMSGAGPADVTGENNVSAQAPK